MSKMRAMYLVGQSKSRLICTGKQVSQQQVVVSKFTQNIHKNMTLKHCGQVVPLSSRLLTTSGAVEVDGRFENTSTTFVPETERPLAVLLTWLAAKEKHLEKYRSLWLQRGFDVLSVKMTPYQFLAPTIGAKPLISDLLKILYSFSDHYPDIVLHCFSVGAYEFGEMLLQLQKEDTRREIGNSCKKRVSAEDPKTAIERRIKGIVMDSPVNFEGAAHGISLSMTRNKNLAKIYESLINGHLSVAYYVATKHYEEAATYAYGNHLKAPALMLVSDGDTIGTPAMSRRLKGIWEKAGVDVKLRCFEKSGHVQHLAMYPEQYGHEIDGFLSKIHFQSLR